MGDEVKVSELNVDEVLGLVGDDKELAASALEAEKAADHPRTTLIEGLEKVLAAEDEALAAAEAEAAEAEAAEEAEEDEADEPASDFAPSNQDLAQAAMVAGNEALKANRDEQLKRRLGK